MSGRWGLMQGERKRLSDECGEWGRYQPGRAKAGRWGRAPDLKKKVGPQDADSFLGEDDALKEGQIRGVGFSGYKNPNTFTNHVIT